MDAEPSPRAGIDSNDEMISRQRRLAERCWPIPVKRGNIRSRGPGNSIVSVVIRQPEPKLDPVTVLTGGDLVSDASLLTTVPVRHTAARHSIRERVRRDRYVKVRCRMTGWAWE